MKEIFAIYENSYLQESIAPADAMIDARAVRATRIELFFIMI